MNDFFAVVTGVAAVSTAWVVSVYVGRLWSFTSEERQDQLGRIARNLYYGVCFGIASWAIGKLILKGFGVWQ